MDWTKAKTILIVVFLVTNLILGGTLVRQKSLNGSSAVSDVYLDQTLAFLEDQGVVLDTQIPRQAPELASVTVEYRFFSPYETAEKLLGSDVIQVAPDTFENDRGRVSVVNDKRLKYQRFTQEDPLPDLQEATLQSRAESFLKEHDLFPERLHLQQIYVGMVQEYDSEPLHKLVFEQTYRDRFIGESYVHVYLNRKGLVAVEALLLTPPGEESQAGTARPMISAPEALLRKLEDIINTQEGRNIIVSRVEPGYYFDLTRDPMTQWDAVASGTAVPAWKIVLKNGDTYYQEAF